LGWEEEVGAFICLRPDNSPIVRTVRTVKGTTKDVALNLHADPRTWEEMEAKGYRVVPCTIQIHRGKDKERGKPWQ